MKLLIKIILLAVGLVLLIILIPARTISQNKQSLPLLSLSNQESGLSVNIREEERNELKSIVKKIKDFVYREATIHNPPGDMMPDNIDNKVIEEVKEKVN